MTYGLIPVSGIRRADLGTAPSSGNVLEIIAFGRQVANPRRSVFDDVTLLLASLPRRYKHCDVAIAMRGASADYEDWIVLRVIGASREHEAACAEWITKQVTRQGYAIVARGLPAAEVAVRPFDPRSGDAQYSRSDIQGQRRTAMTRAVIHLVHKNADDKWHLESAGKQLGAFDTKGEAEQRGKELGHQLEGRGQNAQLVVHRKDGSIETEWTYGHDPRNISG
jgi:hypothetical protein